MRHFQERSQLAKIFRYQQTIFGEIKVREWLGYWQNFCTPTNETECLFQEGTARRWVKAPGNSDAAKMDQFYVLDFYKILYEEIDESMDEYLCTLVEDNPLLR
jgi:hypothetical protein